MINIENGVAQKRDFAPRSWNFPDVEGQQIAAPVTENIAARDFVNIGVFIGVRPQRAPRLTIERDQTAKSAPVRRTRQNVDIHLLLDFGIRLTIMRLFEQQNRRELTRFKFQGNRAFPMRRTRNARPIL